VTALGYSAVSGKAAWLFFVIFNLLAVIVLFKYTATLLQPRDDRHLRRHTRVIILTIVMIGCNDSVMVAFIIEAFQKRQQKANTQDPMLKRIRKVTLKYDSQPTPPLLPSPSH